MYHNGQWGLGAQCAVRRGAPHPSHLVGSLDKARRNAKLERKKKKKKRKKKIAHPRLLTAQLSLILKQSQTKQKHKKKQNKTRALTTNRVAPDCKLEGPAEGIEWLRWHPRGNVILAGSTDGSAWMWSIPALGGELGQ
jgi:delta 1-pyrroline-5-carboxylate dehydrogenase